jgi:hypothetical protein
MPGGDDARMGAPVSCHVDLRRADVYRALLDPDAAAAWWVPEAMSAHIREFDARIGDPCRWTSLAAGGNAPRGCSCRNPRSRGLPSSASVWATFADVGQVGLGVTLGDRVTVDP